LGCAALIFILFSNINNDIKKLKKEQEKIEESINQYKSGSSGHENNSSYFIKDKDGDDIEIKRENGQKVIYSLEEYKEYSRTGRFYYEEKDIGGHSCLILHIKEGEWYLLSVYMNNRYESVISINIDTDIEGMLLPFTQEAKDYINDFVNTWCFDKNNNVF